MALRLVSQRPLSYYKSIRDDLKDSLSTEDLKKWVILTFEIDGNRENGMVYKINTNLFLDLWLMLLKNLLIKLIFE